MAEEGKAELVTVKLISSDDHVFIIDRRAALVSGTIKSMLSGGPSQGNMSNIIQQNFIKYP